MPTSEGFETPEEKALRLGQKPKNPPAQSAGGFVNFAQRFNANKDVAQREAAKHTRQTQGAVDTAAGSLNQAQQKFTQGVNTGTVQAPGGAPSTNTGAAAPPPVAAPVAPPPPQAPPAQNFPTNPAGGQALTGESTRTPESAGPSIADMLAKANQAYTGPAGLDTEQAAIDAEAAQQRLDLLGPDKASGRSAEDGLQTLVNEGGPSGSRGADALSGALIGAAGRKDFDSLRAKFNPNKELLDAQEKAVKEADKAKTDSTANAKGWGEAATAKQKAQDEQDAINTKNAATAKTGREAARHERLTTMPTSQEEMSDPMFGIDPNDPEDVKARTDELSRYNLASRSTDNDAINNAFEDFNSALSPINWGLNAAGKRDPGQDYETKNAHGASGAASGGTNGRNIDWAATGPMGFYVWRQMTDDDWKTINSKPRNGPNSQGAWVAKKYQELVEAQQAKNATKGSPVGRK